MLNTIKRLDKELQDLSKGGEIKQVINRDPLDPFSITYSYNFKTGMACLEDPTILGSDASDALYQSILRDFKVELYSRIYKERKTDVLIKELTGII